MHTKFIIHYSNIHTNIFVCKFQDFNAKLLTPQALDHFDYNFHVWWPNTTNFYEYFN